jgi:hypothetical protein
MAGLDYGPRPREVLVTPQQRKDYLESQLGDRDAVRILLTEASDGMELDRGGNTRVDYDPDAGEQTRAHALTIERKGKGIVCRM